MVKNQIAYTQQLKTNTMNIQIVSACRCNTSSGIPCILYLCQVTYSHCGLPLQVVTFSPFIGVALLLLSVADNCFSSATVNVTNTADHTDQRSFLLYTCILQALQYALGIYAKEGSRPIPSRLQDHYQTAENLVGYQESVGTTPH